MNQSWKKYFVLALGVWALSGSARLLADSAQDYDQAGLALFRAGQYAKSIQYFNNAVQADPNDGQAYEDMGNAYLKLDDKSNALASYQKAQQLNPNDATLQALVDSLGGSTTSGAEDDGQSPSMDSGAPDNSGYAAPQDQNNPPVRPRRLVRVEKPLPAYNDGLPLMDHASVWTSFSIGYAYSAMTDLMNGVKATNQAIAADSDSGTTTFDNSGLGLNFELGFLLSPNNGIGFGLGYRRNSDLNESINFNDGGDFQTIDLQPQVVPLTVDYFLFLPDKSGRFFISAGAGFYYGDIHVDNNYDFSQSEGSSDADDFTGDLNSTALGFQLGVGRSFVVSNRIGISIFAKGYYAKLTNFQGTLTDYNGNSGRFGLAIDSDGTVDVPSTGNIGGASGARYATVDFTGFDVGMTIDFYSF
ncbi:MAG: tetratricopeptide repeat protein [bacterium]